jgi:hypothetical protein
MSHINVGLQDAPPLGGHARALLVSLAFLLDPRRIRLAVAGLAGCDERGGHVGLQDLTHFGRFYVPANSEA